MGGWYCVRFHAQMVEQIYCSAATDLQIAQGSDAMVGWFASQSHALHSNAYPCKKARDIIVRFHVSLDFEWQLSDRGWDGMGVGSSQQFHGHSLQQHQVRDIFVAAELKMV